MQIRIYITKLFLLCFTIPSAYVKAMKPSRPIKKAPNEQTLSRTLTRLEKSLEKIVSSEPTNVNGMAFHLLEMNKLNENETSESLKKKLDTVYIESCDKIFFI
jgi:hypothetical protein